MDWRQRRVANTLMYGKAYLKAQPVIPVMKYSSVAAKKAMLMLEKLAYQRIQPRIYGENAGGDYER